MKKQFVTIYYIKVSSYMPYKIEHEYIEAAQHMHTAIARAVTKYRKENHIAHRRLDALSIQAGRGRTM